jgi:hypothetical protein
MEEIDVAIFAFDHDLRLKLTNRAGERLVGQPIERIEKLPASEIGLESSSAATPSRTLPEVLRRRVGSLGHKSERIP